MVQALSNFSWYNTGYYFVWLYTMRQNSKPALLKLLKDSFYIGAIGYGGPAILAQMKKTFTKDNDWATEKEFMESMSLAQILPGATGVSIMGYFGYKYKKFWGAILMPSFFILPATIAMLILSWLYFEYGSLPFIKPLFAGLGALVVALLLNALFVLGKSVYGKVGLRDYKIFIISLAIFIGSYVLKVNTIWLIILAGIMGFIFFNFTNYSNTDNVTKKEATILRTSSKRKFVLLDYLPLLIISLIVVIILIFPTTRTLFLNFFNIGAFAFGGGFTSIPLIQHIVVDQFNWVNFAQFRDGIAMGQITPGPVFITSTFIGYRVYGVLGALVSTMAVFMPSLILIVLLSSVHNKIKHLKIVRVVIKGFLAGFMGLIAAITIQFAIKSLISWQTWLIFIGVFVYVWYLKKNAIWAIIATVALSFLIF